MEPVCARCILHHRARHSSALDWLIGCIAICLMRPRAGWRCIILHAWVGWCAWMWRRALHVAHGPLMLHVQHVALRPAVLLVRAVRALALHSFSFEVRRAVGFAAARSYRRNSTAERSAATLVQ